MATTTNYGWTTPDDTALVKDGAAAIRTLGSSIDTTTKALNPSTTLGDIEYRSSTANTNTRLGIGTTGQILTVSGGVPSWATPAGSSSAVTQIADTTLASAAADITFSSIPSTYNHLMIVINGFGTSAAANGAKLFLQMNADAGSNYSYSRNVKYGGGGATVTIEGANSNTSIDMGYLWCGTAVSALAGAEIMVLDYKGTTLNKSVTYNGGSYSDAPQAGSGWGRWKSNSAITSLKLTTDATNFGIGTRATLYGLV